MSGVFRLEIWEDDQDDDVWYGAVFKAGIRQFKVRLSKTELKRFWEGWKVDKHEIINDPKNIINFVKNIRDLINMGTMESSEQVAGAMNRLMVDISRQFYPQSTGAGKTRRNS